MSFAQSSLLLPLEKRTSFKDILYKQLTVYQYFQTQLSVVVRIKLCSYGKIKTKCQLTILNNT